MTNINNGLYTEVEKNMYDWLKTEYQKETECDDEEIENFFVLFCLARAVLWNNDDTEDFKSSILNLCINEYAGYQTGYHEALNILKSVNAIINTVKHRLKYPPYENEDD